MFFPPILCHWSQFWHQKNWKNEIINFKNSDFCKLLRVCWFLGKNLSNFIPPAWEFDNPYCNNIREWSIHFKLGTLYLLKSHFDFFECVITAANCYLLWSGNVCARLRICEISNISHIRTPLQVLVQPKSSQLTYRFDNWQSTSIVSYFPKKIAWHIWLK